MTERFQAIVVGCGAIGAATGYWLSRQLGERVLVLEQYELGHPRGASEDHSRVIRHAYTSATYTALTPAAYQTWGLLERATGLTLVHRTGGLIIADSESDSAALLTDTAAAMAAQDISYEELTAAQVNERWPQWLLEPRHCAIHDPEAGILDIRRATAAHVALARGHGTIVREHAPVDAIEETGSGVRLTAAGTEYTADSVVLCGGSWNPVLLRMLGVDLPITLTEEQATYFATPNIRDFTPERFTIFAFVGADGVTYYGIPVYGNVGIKAAIDSGGPVVTPQTRTYQRDPVRVDRVRGFLERHLPGAVGPELYTRVCCYDSPPDGGFIVDHVPGSERVLVCDGAGHAGKFAALLGRILSQLVLDGESQLPIDAFRSDRPALTGSAPARSRRRTSL
jgi:sarcosine oxidase